MFDSHTSELLEPGFLFAKRADSIARGRNEDKSGVVLLPGAGWVLRPYIFDPGAAHETIVGGAGVQSVDAGLLTVAGSFVEKPFFRDPGLTGVTYSGAPSSGSLMWQKRPGAGDSWADALDADQANYPSPAAGDDTVDMDRVAKTTENFDPDEAVFFRFYTPGSHITAGGSLATVYFTGLAGTTDAIAGCGQYALKLNGDGLAVLYERGAGETGSAMWHVRHSFRWAAPQLVYGSMNALAIGSDAVHLASPDRYAGRRIYFRTLAYPNANAGFSLTETTIAVAIAAIDVSSGAFDSVYNVPRPGEAAVEVAPVRVDLRRDVRAICQVHKAVYRTSGALTDDVFSLVVPCQDAATNFYVEWYATVPAGCAVDVKMYDASTGLELADATLTISDELGGQKTYTPNVGQRSYYLKAALTGDGSKTPVLTEVRVVRAPVVEDAPATVPATYPSARTGLWQDAVTSVNISGPGDSPDHETMTLGLQDIVGNIAALDVRSGMPIKVQTTFDAAGTDRSVLFQGYVSQARGTRKFAGPESKPYPYPGALEYEVTALGQYRRLQEQLMPRRWTWFDQSANAGYKVTDAIRLVLRASGAKDADIDVPDLPLRLFSLNEDDLVSQPGDTLLDVAVRFARDYLGAYLLYDPNAGTSGMWRLLQAKQAPYNVLARFETEHPGAGKVVADGAYADASATSPLGNTQAIKRTFIARRNKRSTLRSWVEPPEGNVVVVYGGANEKAAQKAGGNETVILTQSKINTDSFNFAGVASSDPDYPDVDGPDYLGRIVPIMVFDPSLPTQEAVDWMAVRTFRYACHAQRHLEFEAPLVLVTDADDSLQAAPRPLRFYDCAEVWDPATAAYVQYMVASCDPLYDNDRLQMARYTLVRPSNLDVFADVQLRAGIARERRADEYARKRSEGKTMRTPTKTAPQTLIRDKMATWMEMPEAVPTAIQDLTPGSPSFGDRYWMLDMDGLA